jgi:serine/threonine protein kinase
LTSKSGTLAYLAPEVYAGHGYDVRADWWSLGVLFYECIYNKVSEAFSTPHPQKTLGFVALALRWWLFAATNQIEHS